MAEPNQPDGMQGLYRRTWIVPLLIGFLSWAALSAGSDGGEAWDGAAPYYTVSFALAFIRTVDQSRSRNSEMSACLGLERRPHLWDQPDCTAVASQRSLRAWFISSKPVAVPSKPLPNRGTRRPRKVSA